MKIRLLILLLLVTTGFSLPSPIIKSGILDLRNYDLEEESAIALAGDAELYWRHHYTASELDTLKPDAVIKLPGTWNNVVTQRGDTLTGIGYGTVRLKVLLPTEVPARSYALKPGTILSSYRLYIDTSLILQVGSPGKSEKRTTNDYEPTVCFTPLVKDSFSIILHISNFEDNKGGPWETIYLGSKTAIHHLQEVHVSFDLFFIGVLLAFALLHLGNSAFLNRHDNTFASSRYLGFFTLIITLRTALMGERIMYVLFPSVPLSFFLLLEYLTFYFGLVFWHHYINVMFKQWSSDRYTKILTYTAASFAVLTLLTPLIIHSRFIPLYELVIGTTLLYQLYIGYKAIRESPVQSIMLILSTLIIILTAIHDIMRDLSYATTMPLLPLGSAIVAIANGGVIMVNNHNIFVQNKAYAYTLKMTNITLAKFIPNQFFAALKTTSTDVKLGDHVTKRMTTLFCDIRNFTTISEKISTGKTFQYINEYLAIITPAIEDNGGFIDKFIGDAVIALFPGRPDNAVEAALRMQESLHASNLNEKYRLQIPLQVGIGIHYDTMILGIIGGSSRLDSTVIGDAVNTASRIEQLTKTYGVDTIITKNVLINCSQELQDQLSYRHLGAVKLKGKRERVWIYDLFSTKNKSTKLKKRLIAKEPFEEGVMLYERDSFQEAEKKFQEAERLFPQDKAIKHYLTLCQKALQQ